LCELLILPFLPLSVLADHPPGMGDSDHDQTNYQTLVIGDSIIRRTGEFLAANHHPVLYQSIHFWGQGGLVLQDCPVFLQQTLYQISKPPSQVVIAVGTNNLIQSSTSKIIRSLKKLFNRITIDIPHSIPIYSFILPRKIYKNKGSKYPFTVQRTKTLEKKRKTINRIMQKYLGKDRVLRHDNICPDSCLKGGLDGVHLNKEGTIKFLDNFHQWLKRQESQKTICK